MSNEHSTCPSCGDAVPIKTKFNVEQVGQCPHCEENYYYLIYRDLDKVIQVIISDKPGS